MVQRKVPNKLGIQADHAETENKLLGNLKSSSSHQHLDVKNKGADLKKIMKKSGSFKRSDIDGSRSKSSRKEPSKPAIQKKQASQSPNKGSSSNGSPNYMKSTTSSAARKEITQVSLQSSPTGTDCKTPKSKNSSIQTLVNHKPARTLTRTSSLKKLVRTLTKTPSFKPARTTTKQKRSQVVLCENLDVQRSTCSSTLKDSKFPVYLPLNPGGTELEGTSIMKVCTYTYCSLNGHHHNPSPPLKQFLAARRRMLKTQKSFKLGCLSPRRSKPSKGGEREISSGELGLSNWERSDISFVETENTTETPDFEIEGRAEYSSDKPMCPEIYIENNLDAKSGVNSTGMDIAEFFFAEEDQKFEFVSNQVELEDELVDPESEDSDMEWEEGPYSIPYIDDEIGSSTQSDNGSGLEGGYSSKTNINMLCDEPISKSHNIVSTYPKEVPADEILQEVFDEESASFEAWFGDENSKSQVWQSDESIPVPDIQGHSQVSPPYNETEGITTNQETDVDEETEVSEEVPRMDLQLGVDETDSTSKIEVEGLIAHKENESFENNEERAFTENQHISSADPIEEDKEDTYKDFANDNVIEVYQSNDAAEEISNDNVIAETKDSDAKLPALDDILQGFSEAAQDETKEENDDESQIKVISEASNTNEDLEDKALSAETQGHSSDERSRSNTVIKIQNYPENDQDGAGKLKNISSLDSQDHEENANQEIVEMEVEKKTESNVEERSPPMKNASFNRGSKSNQEVPDTSNILIKISRGKIPIEDLEEPRDFNPREPNYLPMEPDPEGEKVDLKHQMMDERRNAEEWMLDYALQQAVTKLAPARKRKVALLVEAFETVAPTPKYGNSMRHTSAAFTHSRPIQACS